MKQQQHLKSAIDGLVVVKDDKKDDNKDDGTKGDDSKDDGTKGDDSKDDSTKGDDNKDNSAGESKIRTTVRVEVTRRKRQQRIELPRQVT